MDTNRETTPLENLTPANYGNRALERYGYYGNFRRASASSTLPSLSQSTKAVFTPINANHTRASSVRTSLEEDMPRYIVSLADITNFPLRLKVAQLLAIAPELPIQELYNLLVRMQGNLEKARASVSQRTSHPLPHDMLPTAVNANKTSTNATPEAFKVPPVLQSKKTIDDGDEVEEDTMMKAEASDYDIWNDSDISMSSSITGGNPKKTKRSGPSKSSTKISTQSRLQAKTRRKRAGAMRQLAVISTDGMSDDQSSLSDRPRRAWAYSTSVGSYDTPISEYRPSRPIGSPPFAGSPKGLRSRARRQRSSTDRTFPMAGTDEERVVDAFCDIPI